MTNQGVLQQGTLLVFLVMNHHVNCLRNTVLLEFKSCVGLVHASLCRAIAWMKEGQQTQYGTMQMSIQTMTNLRWAMTQIGGTLSQVCLHYMAKIGLDG